MDSAAYRKLQDASVSGHSGSSLLEIQLITSIMHVDLRILLLMVDMKSRSRCWFGS